ncbi:MAG: winged helix-turn-helix domain-containing protein [Candidatus Omnitrophota bacterium]
MILNIRSRARLGEKVGRNAQKILNLMLEKKDITIRELSEAIDISTTAVENNIKKLQEKGLIKRVGSDKGGHWEVIENKGQ